MRRTLALALAFASVSASVWLPAQSQQPAASGYQLPPKAIVDRLNGEINLGLTDPNVSVRLVDYGSTAMPMAPEQFGKFIADETEKWAKVIKFARIRPD